MLNLYQSKIIPRNSDWRINYDCNYGKWI